MPIVTYQINTLRGNRAGNIRQPRRQPSNQPTGAFLSGLDAACDALGLSVDRVKTLIQDNRLKCLKIGRRYYFRPEWLESVGQYADQTTQSET